MGQIYEFSKPRISNILHSARIQSPITYTKRTSNSRTNALLPKSMKEIFILGTTVLLWNFSWLNMRGIVFNSLFIFLKIISCDQLKPPVSGTSSILLSFWTMYTHGKPQTTHVIESLMIVFHNLMVMACCWRQDTYKSSNMEKSRYYLSIDITPTDLCSSYWKRIFHTTKCER